MSAPLSHNPLPMACDLTLTGRSLPCRNALGGIKRVWFCDEKQGPGFWDPIDDTGATAGEVEDSTAAQTFNYWDLPKNSSSLTQTVNASIENGTVYYTQVLSMVINNIVAADIDSIEEMGKGDLSIVVEDVNGNFMVMGHKNGSILSGGTGGTGATMADLNGFTLEFTANEVDAAPFLHLDSNGEPEGTNLTFTNI